MSVVWSYRRWQYPVRRFSHWYGLRLSVMYSLALVSDAYGAGRGTGFRQRRQLSSFVMALLWPWRSSEVPVAIVLLCWMGITTP